MLSLRKPLTPDLFAQACISPGHSSPSSFSSLSSCCFFQIFHKSFLSGPSVNRMCFSRMGSFHLCIFPLGWKGPRGRARLFWKAEQITALQAEFNNTKMQTKTLQFAANLTNTCFKSSLKRTNSFFCQLYLSGPFCCAF